MAMAATIHSMRGADGMSGSATNSNHTTPKASIQKAPFTVSAVNELGGSFSLSVVAISACYY
jgi:hypothetical protein